MLKPVSPAFNAVIMRLADRFNPRGYAVLNDAPDTLAKLQAYHAEHGRIAVWSGKSDRTIYADDEVNFAFRAWHDARHLALGADFTPEGEALVAAQQIADVLILYGADAPKLWLRLIEAEIVGQQRYQERHGAFPENQRGFDLAYIRNPVAALASPAYLA